MVLARAQPEAVSVVGLQAALAQAAQVALVAVEHPRDAERELDEPDPLVPVLDEVSDEIAPGYVEFEFAGRPHRLDVVGDDKGLFIIFKDRTAGETTYGAGRFLYVEEKPQPNARFLLDLNRAYNPPCAFSEFTTCPLPPKQNKLTLAVTAGEKKFGDH